MSWTSISGSMKRLHSLIGITCFLGLLVHGLNALGSRNEILHSDHDLATDKPSLSLLMDGESFPRIEISIPPSLKLPERMNCALCDESYNEDDQSSRGACRARLLCGI